MTIITGIIVIMIATMTTGGNRHLTPHPTAWCCHLANLTAYMISMLLPVYPEIFIMIAAIVFRSVEMVTNIATSQESKMLLHWQLQ